jgi:hypothetical protein
MLRLSLMQRLTAMGYGWMLTLKHRGSLGGIKKDNPCSGLIKDIAIVAMMHSNS